MPAPSVTLSDMVRNYLTNRTDFYTSLLPRLPDARVRERMRETSALQSSAQLMVDEPLNDEFLTALKTLDLLKKGSHGTALGRTAISIEEALQRAEQIEETGILLFTHVSRFQKDTQNALAAEIETCKSALSKLLLLHDELRYHRLALIPPE